MELQVLYRSHQALLLARLAGIMKFIDPHFWKAPRLKLGCALYGFTLDTGLPFNWKSEFAHDLAKTCLAHTVRCFNLIKTHSLKGTQAISCFISEILWDIIRKIVMEKEL